MNDTRETGHRCSCGYPMTVSEMPEEASIADMTEWLLGHMGSVGIWCRGSSVRIECMHPDIMPFHEMEGCFSREGRTIEHALQLMVAAVAEAKP